MKSYVLSLKDMDKTQLAVAGGKGANLGELSRVEGIQVPEGFCITTDAYVRAVESSEEFNALVGELSALSAGELVKVSEMSGKIRGLIEALPIPAEIEEEIKSCAKANTPRPLTKPYPVTTPSAGASTFSIPKSWQRCFMKMLYS